MGKLILRRVLISIPLLLIVSSIVFILQSLLPGDAATLVGGFEATPEQLEAIRRELGLNDPVWMQYLRWLGSAITGDLGSSYANGQPVVEILNTRVTVSLSIILGATILATILGVVLGMLSSWGPAWVGRFVDGLSIFGLAVPSFWIGLVLVSIFAVTLRVLPATGYVQPGDNLGGWFASILLPVIALSSHGITAIAKQTREAMLDVGNRDFIRNLRANGIPERSVVLRHSLRSAGIPIVTITGLLFVGSLTGAVVIEQIFGLPGLGSLAVTATSTLDIPVIQGVAVYFTLIVIAVNLITDLVYGWINPKVRTA
ncbi:MAG: ABC transporter permease [Salinibacterium sp.]|nr:ABC transporter permease [Salinibacterium sp.]